MVTHLLELRERKNEKGETEFFAFSAPHIVEGIVNHISGHRASAGIYNQAQYFAEKRDALQQWASHLTALLAAPALTPISASRRETNAYRERSRSRNHWVTHHAQARFWSSVIRHLAQDYASWLSRVVRNDPCRTEDFYYLYRGLEIEQRREVGGAY